MPKHPGKTLLEDFMVPLELTANQVAKGLGLNRSTVGRLIAGEQRLTPEMAARLAAYFQMPVKWWLQMQADFDVQEVALQPELWSTVTPLDLDPSLLLTPTGILHLGDPEGSEPTALSLSRSEIESMPQSSTLPRRKVHEVHYESGSVALVGEE